MDSDSGDDFVRYLRERLAALGTITTRRMFGAVGVFCDGLMIGILADGGLFLRVDAGNRSAFERARFGPASGGVVVMVGEARAADGLARWRRWRRFRVPG